MKTNLQNYGFFVFIAFLLISLAESTEKISGIFLSRTKKLLLLKLLTPGRRKRRGKISCHTLITTPLNNAVTCLLSLLVSGMASGRWVKSLSFLASRFYGTTNKYPLNRARSLPLCFIPPGLPFSCTVTRRHRKTCL